MRRELVLGGARSGKSNYAQQQAQASGLQVSVIVTAEIRDEEMAARIALHRNDRPASWQTIEAAFDLPEAIARTCSPDHFVLVDCVTLWLSNLMCYQPDQLPIACDALLAAVSQTTGPLTLVSNEVGWGIVPDSPLGRAFRDEAGILNQRLAAICDKVILVVAGIPMSLR